jgi:hypothetical protein
VTMPLVKLVAKGAKHMRSYRNGPELVSASEIAAFVFCPEQYRLEHGLGLEPGNRAALVAGTQHHEQKAVAEQIAGGSIAMGRFLAIVAALCSWCCFGWCGDDRDRLDGSGGGACPDVGPVACAGRARHASAARPGRRQNNFARPGHAHIASSVPDRKAGSPHQSGWHDRSRGMEILIAMHLIPWVGGMNQRDRSLVIVLGVSESSGFQHKLNQPVSPESAAWERLLYGASS